MRTSLIMLSGFVGHPHFPEVLVLSENSRDGRMSELHFVCQDVLGQHLRWKAAISLPDGAPPLAFTDDSMEHLFVASRNGHMWTYVVLETREGREVRRLNLEDLHYTVHAFPPYVGWQDPGGFARVTNIVTGESVKNQALPDWEVEHLCESAETIVYRSKKAVPSLPLKIWRYAGSGPHVEVSVSGAMCDVKYFDHSSKIFVSMVKGSMFVVDLQKGALVTLIKEMGGCIFDGMFTNNDVYRFITWNPRNGEFLGVFEFDLLSSKVRRLESSLINKLGTFCMMGTVFYAIDGSVIDVGW